MGQESSSRRRRQQPLMGAQFGPAGGAAHPPGQWSMDPMEELRALPELQVKERASLLQEASPYLVGVEVNMRNRYQVLDTIGNQRFFAIERTDPCTRQLQDTCCKDCAGWTVDVNYTPPGQYMTPFLHLRKPTQCACCCCCRPTADVIDVSQVNGRVAEGRKIGSFKDPFTCFHYNFELKDELDSDVLFVRGGCCQPAVWCSLPCGPCSRLDFEVMDSQHKGRVARVQKQVPNWFTYMFAPETDNYHIHFDQVLDPGMKAMLLAFTIYTDFRFFNSHKGAEELGIDAHDFR